MTTTIASRFPSLARHGAAPSRHSYAHAHWYFLALFAVILAGFWPSFARPANGRTVWGTLHGLTASLWYVGLITQSWLMSRGRVVWHRRVARGMVLVLLPMLCLSALVAIRVLAGGPPIGPIARLRPQIALGDFVSVAEIIALVALGLRNRHTPPAHQRYMAASGLVGLPPALFRLYRTLGVRWFNPLAQTQASLWLLLVVLIAVDWRMDERTRCCSPRASSAASPSPCSHPRGGGWPSAAGTPPNGSESEGRTSRRRASEHAAQEFPPLTAARCARVRALFSSSAVHTVVLPWIPSKSDGITHQPFA